MPSSSWPSSSSSSSSSLFSKQSKRTMEEVWKDISLNNLQDNSLEEGRESYREMILRDFLARPNNNKEPPPPPHSANRHVDIEPFGNNLSLFNSGTVLRENSGSDSQRVNWLGYQSKNNPIGRNHAGNCRFSSETTAVLGLSFCKRRFPDSGTDEESVDRRHKRMIKNRESAARSRARKQAYTNELEHEVAHLMEENARLRKQQQENQSAMQVPQPKHSLCRTLTAPF